MSPASNTNDSSSSQAKVVPLDPFWLNRWQSLNDLINSAIKEMPAKGDHSHFQSILKALQCFGRNHFFYFFLGFGGKIEEGEHPLLEADEENCPAQPQWFNDFNSSITESPLKIDPEHPPNYVLRRIIDQISMDFEAIQRAYYQRIYGSDRQKGTLMVADNWGTEILNQFKMNTEKGLKDDALVITYFDYTTKINICPYTNVALIGIPFTAAATNDYRDLLLLPHELGHYVYHKAKMGNKPLKQYIDDELKRAYISSSNDKTKDEKKKLITATEQVSRWSEELFCDVFGLFTSREPAVVATTLSMVADNHPHHAYLDNKTYPIDALRSWISLKTIEDIENQLNKASTGYTLSHGYLKLISKSAKSYIEEMEQKIRRPRSKGNPQPPTMEQANQVLDNGSGKKTPQLTPLEEVLFGLITKIVTELREFISIHFWHSLGAKGFEAELEVVMIEINSLNLSGFPEIDDLSGSNPKPEDVRLNIDTLYKAFSSRRDNLEKKRPENNEGEDSLAVENYTDLYNSKKEELTNFPIKIEDWKPILEANGWGVRGPEGRPTGDRVIL